MAAHGNAGPFVAGGESDVNIAAAITAATLLLKVNARLQAQLRDDSDDEEGRWIDFIDADVRPGRGIQAEGKKPRTSECEGMSTTGKNAATTMILPLFIARAASALPILTPFTMNASII